MEYAVLIEGANSHINLDGKPRRMGFFIWRCVESVSETEAGLLAVQLVRELLSDTAVNSPDDPTRLMVKEIRTGFGDLTPPGSGFMYFPEATPSFWERLKAKVTGVRIHKINAQDDSPR